MTTVSVVIPCFRDSETLASALDSVRAQTHKALEVIVVNDCSPETARIESVLAGYPEVKYFRNPKNLGLAATRNAGAQLATSDVLTFLDADDELHPQKIEFQLSVFEPALAVSCNVKRFSTSEEFSRVENFHAPCPWRCVNNSRAIVWRNSLTGASIMISRGKFLSIGGYDTSLRSCEDFDLWLRLLDAGTPVSDILWPLYLYRRNPQGLSRNAPNISYWEYAVINKYFARAKVSGVAPVSEGLTRIWWLTKHFRRSAIAGNRALFEATVSNMDTLHRWPVLRLCLVPLAWLVAVRLLLSR
jgi:glycosyltransferase involved in cell wall biosynthesis